MKNESGCKVVESKIFKCKDAKCVSSSSGKGGDVCLNEATCLGKKLFVSLL